MRGGNVNEFLDHSTYEECAILYNGKKYFFHGLIRNERKNTYSYDIEIWNTNHHFEKRVFDGEYSSCEECMREALKQPIFEGKTFWEAEKDMEWVDW
jgi:hypothetical protein